MHSLCLDGTFNGWKVAARKALLQSLPPTEIMWLTEAQQSDGLSLFTPLPTAPSSEAGKEFRVPKDFLNTARTVAAIRSGEQWALLYRMLWRLTHGEPHLMELPTDPDVRRLHELEKAIRRDSHKMHAFVRFREVATEHGAWFAAWFEPEHLIVEANADFFINRFASMRWSILTPDRCAHWDLKEIHFTAGVAKSAAPNADAKEHLWLTYYSNIFNPARIKTQAMQKEMPKKYWKNLPEAAAIEPLLKAAPQRTALMLEKSRQQSAADSNSDLPV